MSYDVIVIGTGAMGSAACHQLAKRGVKTLGLEQYSLGHARGSSHGQTRLIRKAYFEEERYVPLLHRAYELWDELALESKRNILHRTGLLIMGPELGGNALPKLLASAAKHAIAVETLSPSDLAKRFPRFTPPEGYRGVFEPGAGYLEVENGVLAHCALARARGAEIHDGEAVKSWRASAAGVEVVTDKATYRAAKLVVTAGAWTGRLLADLGLPLRVLRIPQFWFPASEAWDHSPCFAFDKPEGFVYGFPRLSPLGLKVAEYHPGNDLVEDPALVDRAIRESDVKKIASCVASHLPGVSPAYSGASVCMYTMSPDENFIVDIHPRHPNVSFAGGFSGHGFKFATVMGECLADLAQKGGTALPTSFLKLRFSPR